MVLEPTDSEESSTPAGANTEGSDEDPVVAGAEGVVQIIDGHPQRILLGWLDDGEAQVALAAAGVLDLTDQSSSLISTARAAVAARPESIDQSGVIVGEVPAEVQEHVVLLRQMATAAPYFTEGWEPKMVDLRQVVALQPAVAFDSAAARTSGVSASDFRGLAQMTLPSGPPEPVPFGRDAMGVWTCSSPNQNLRVLTPACGPMPCAGGNTVVGYVIGIMPSFMQVAEVDGRFVMRDGYHRAVGLLSHGITVVPAFVRQFPTVEGLLVPGLFRSSVFMGSRPPVLSDFLDDGVTTTRFHPRMQKVVMVQATETAIAA